VELRATTPNDTVVTITSVAEYQKSPALYLLVDRVQYDSVCRCESDWAEISIEYQSCRELGQTICWMDINLSAPYSGSYNCERWSIAKDEKLICMRRQYLIGAVDEAEYVVQNIVKRPPIVTTPAGSQTIANG